MNTAGSLFCFQNPEFWCFLVPKFWFFIKPSLKYALKQNTINFYRFTVNATIVALQIGICGVYFVFISEHLKELTEQYSNFTAPLTTYLLLLFVPICLVSFVRTLKGIAVFSTIGNIFMTICLVYVFQVSLFV